MSIICEGELAPATGRPPMISRPSKDGRIKREELDKSATRHGIMRPSCRTCAATSSRMQKVREALNYAFDFEDLNRTIFFYAATSASTAISGAPNWPPPACRRGARTGNPERAEGQGSAGGLHHALHESRRRRSARSCATICARPLALFKEAGYEAARATDGERQDRRALQLRDPADQPDHRARRSCPTPTSLKKIGIDARVRTVDSSQYIESRPQLRL